ncbi:MAG: preprotein translocase subunit SecA [Planctomycetota bacterium]|nr:preprotein translocase subunit SecA [Planctomycetota bacterium]
MSRLPSTTWQMLAERPADRELPRGLDAAWDAAVGMLVRLKPRRSGFMARAARVLAMEKGFRDLSEAHLRERAAELRQKFRFGRDTPEDLERAFAVVAEVAFRRLGLRLFQVQVAGALALEAGCVVEMATGEGKTLTAVLPATIGGWRGRGCHVVTVNDYLAARDAEWMKPIYQFCGLSVAAIAQGMHAPERCAAYQADITYCTNKEVTADFLRDRLSLGRLQGLPSALMARIVEGAGSGTDRLVQRGLACAIVDEADSVLIDEAVTPLIISGDAPNPEQVEAFRQAVTLSEQLHAGSDFRANERYREVELTTAGKERLAILAQPLGGLWHGARRREELVVQALVARQFYVRDKQYIIHEDKVVIVDEFTGRLMPDREWRDGLHQAVSAKEAVKVVPPKDTYARLSFQRFFRLYRKLSGMTGTAAEGWREFWQIYHMPVVRIPTNRPCIRRRWPDRVLATEQAKWQAIVEEIRRVHEAGRPVLVGTRSVRASERLAVLLNEAGLECQVLNAVRHAEEAQIVAAAGGQGKVTVATNMAGRGTDIKLAAGVADLGGLHVIATERHEAGRIDRQLFGRCGRQGDPGTCQAIVSLEDELVVRHSPHLSATLRRRYGKSDRDIGSVFANQVFDHAQRRAERLALAQRKAVLQADNWLDQYLGFAGRET